MVLRAPRFTRSSRLQQAAHVGPFVRRGEVSAGVRDLQQALIDLGFKMPLSTSRGTRRADGVFGTETEAVLKKFQGAQLLRSDGIAGPKTLGRLDQIFLRNDPFYKNPALEEALLAARMASSSPPFAITTDRDDV